MIYQTIKIFVVNFFFNSLSLFRFDCENLWNINTPVITINWYITNKYFHPLERIRFTFDRSALWCNLFRSVNDLRLPENRNQSGTKTKATDPYQGGNLHERRPILPLDHCGIEAQVVMDERAFNVLSCCLGVEKYEKKDTGSLRKSPRCVSVWVWYPQIGKWSSSVGCRTGLVVRAIRSRASHLLVDPRRTGVVNFESFRVWRKLYSDTAIIPFGGLFCLKGFSFIVREQVIKLIWALRKNVEVNELLIGSNSGSA